MGAAIIVAALLPLASAPAVEADARVCLLPGLPLADEPSPQLMRAARAQLDAYRACTAEEVARLRVVAPERADALRAEADRISERWAHYEERYRARKRR